MGWQQIAKEYLSFSKKDRTAVLGLMLMVAFIYLLPVLFTSSDEATAQADTTVIHLIDTLENQQSNNPPANYQRYNDGSVDAFQPSKRIDFTKGELFPFDPNTLTTGDWQRLGLSEKTAATIQKYVSRGGSFKKPEDLKKIWGLPKGFYERVEPYIKIESITANTPFKPNYSATTYEKKERKIVAVEINAADTSAWIALPGIGSKLAARITNFREKLGGFYSVEQVKETYGVPDSTFQKIKPYLSVNPNGVKKININTATKDELKMHPYIKWNVANAIVEHRAQHGAFTSLNDLKNIVLIDDDAFKKMAPYLSF